MFNFNSEAIRNFFRNLFTSRLTLEFAAQCEEWRDRFERLERTTEAREFALEGRYREDVRTLRDLHAQEIARIGSEHLTLEVEQMSRVSDLKVALAKTEKERDYFRGRADRIELELFQQRKPPAPGPPRKINLMPVGRKRWQDVQAEEARRNAEFDEQEKAAKTAAAPAPQPDAETKAAG